LPSPLKERGLKNCPSLEGRGLRGGCLNVALLMNYLDISVKYCKEDPI